MIDSPEVGSVWERDGLRRKVVHVFRMHTHGRTSVSVVWVVLGGDGIDRVSHAGGWRAWARKARRVDLGHEDPGDVA